MTNFLSKQEKTLSKQYQKEGFIITKVDNIESLEWIKKKYIEIITKELKIKFKTIKEKEQIFNNFHKYISVKNLNDIRLKIFNSINLNKDFRYHYYNLAKPFLNIINGNELVMQKKINLSIQLPKDNSSTLPVHADTWSGDSPFETVVWLPLVDCYRTKSMYILKPKKAQILNKDFHNVAQDSSAKLFNNIKKDLTWLNIKYGEVLLFNQTLPHGNVINNEKETRWSMNCRFKSIFSPYGDKKLGEFFEPITLRTASIIGMDYKYPKIK